jgi:hypothetical protein
MAYEPKTWADGEAGGTPITADSLNHIETGIATVETTPGPKGDKGDTGATGPAGPAGADGADGADGFPTEEDWNALVARVEALEGGAE